MIECKSIHYPKSIILHAVFFYLRYAVSYRDLEEIRCSGRSRHAEQLGGEIRSVDRRSGTDEEVPDGHVWRVDETYIKVKNH